jgi:hypothetical protein
MAGRPAGQFGSASLVHGHCLHGGDGCRPGGPWPRVEDRQLPEHV